MAKLISFAQKGIPLPFKGINNSRDFINVKNLISVLRIVVNNKIGGIILPTDKEPASTEMIINIIRKYSPSKVRLISVPKFMLLIIKFLNKKIYNKVYGSLNIKCNLSNDIYKPKSSFELGIKDMISDSGSIYK